MGKGHQELSALAIHTLAHESPKNTCPDTTFTVPIAVTF